MSLFFIQTSHIQGKKSHPPQKNNVWHVTFTLSLIHHHYSAYPTVAYNSDITGLIMPKWLLHRLQAVCHHWLSRSKSAINTNSMRNHINVWQFVLQGARSGILLRMHTVKKSQKWEMRLVFWFSCLSGYPLCDENRDTQFFFLFCCIQQPKKINSDPFFPSFFPDWMK